MADAILDQFDSPLPAWGGSSPVSPWGTPKSPLRDTFDSQRSPGTSRENPITLPSDESDYDSDDACEYDDGGDFGSRSAANIDKESGRMAGGDHSFSASLGTGGDADAAEASTVPGPEQDHEALGAERLPAPPFSPESSERRSASAEPLRLAQDSPSPVSNIYVQRICDKGAEVLSSVSPARGAEPLSLGCLTGHLEDRPDGECQKASGNDGDGEAETPTAKRTRRKVAVHYESRHAPSTSIVNADGEDEGCRSDTRGNLQTSSGSRRHDDQDENARQPPRKRRRKCSTAAAQQTGSHCSDRRRRQVQRERPFQNRRSRHGIPSPPSSEGPGNDIETVQAQFAGFEQWQLPNAVLKRATVNGQATFQLEFSWGACSDHKRKDAPPCRRQRKPLAERHHSIGQSPASTVAAPTPADEEEWEVQHILASRIHCEELQYQVKWANWEDDQEWYYADGFKKSPRLLKQYHQDHPEMAGPPVRLEQWLRAYENGVEDDHHPDDNKQLRDGSD